MKTYFLDVASTVKPYPEVISVITDTMSNHYGNPSSIHAIGRDARSVIENVRDKISEDINCDPSEIIFTSGACEANSLALVGSGYSKLITTHLEHKSIEKVQDSNHFCTICFANVDKHGNVDFDNLTKLLRTSYPCLVSIQFANSEIGTIQNIKSIASIVHGFNGCALHVDATQAFPEMQIDVNKYDIDMMSVSAQKFGGGRGAGFLYCRNGIAIKPIIYGSQEGGLRGGTYNTPAIAGMGKALEITRKNSNINAASVLLARNYMAVELCAIDGVNLVGPTLDSNRLRNNISICIDGVCANDLVTIASMHGIMISAGSACSGGASVPSSTLNAIGLTDEQALSTVRITIDEYLEIDDVDYIVKILKGLINQIRNY